MTARAILKTPGSAGGTVVSDYTVLMDLLAAEPAALIEVARAGLPAGTIPVLARAMGCSQDYLLEVLDFKRATALRKMREGANLTTAETERLLGLAGLIHLAGEVVQHTGGPADFDAAKWFSDWIEQVNPALGSVPPADLLDTHHGQHVVETLIRQMASGAYA